MFQNLTYRFYIFIDMKRLFVLLFLIFISCNETEVNKQTVVGIVPYNEMNSEKVIRLKDAVHEYYGVEVKLLEKQELPESAFINIKSPRYRADSIIAIQERMLTDDFDYILGLTEKDISVTKHDKDGRVKKPVWRYNDFGVMGLAYCPGHSCIVSGYRL